MRAWILLLSVLSIGMTSAPVIAQGSGSDAASTDELESLAPLTTEAELAQVSMAELSVAVLPRRVDELETLAEEWVGALESASRSLASMVITAADGAGVDQEAVNERRDVVSGLAARTAIILDELEAKGGDVGSARNYVKAAQRLVTNVAPVSQSAAGSDDEAEVDPAAEMAARVLAEARRIEAEPPVHERTEPWTVPVAELLKEIQPLRREKIEERVEAWLGILEREVRKRNRLNIAADQATEPGLRDALIARANEEDQIVQAVVERVDALIDVVERRGGDMIDQRRYVGNATGVPLNWANPEVLYAQIMAWLTRPDGGIKVGLRIVQFLAVMFAFWIAAKIIGAVVAAAVKRLPRASALLREFLVGGVKRVVMIIGLVVAIGALGVNIGPLVAAIGAAGLVIGLALQGTLSNFASGILILVYRPYDVGDYIDAGGVSGKVEAMNLVVTRIATFDNQVLYVPNNQIWNNVITNINGRDKRRVDMKFGIGYGDDIAKAERIIREIIEAHPKTLDDPAPTVKVHELGDNSVNLIVRPWSKVADYWDVYWDVTRSIKERFSAEGVGIPFPQRDLHLPEPIEVVLKNG